MQGCRRVLKWFQRWLEAERLATADADGLIRDHGADAYSEARNRQRDGVLHNGNTEDGRTPAHWRRVALIAARRTGDAVGVNTAKRILVEPGRRSGAADD